MIETTPTATHLSGNRNDYILLALDLAAGTVVSKMLPITYHLISDHRASYCDIDTDILFSEPRLEDISCI